MFKFLRVLLVLKILISLGGLTYLYITRVEKTEKFLSKKLHCDVTLSDISIGWNTVKIEKLRISSFFKADELEIEALPWNLLKADIEISKVKVWNPTFGIPLLVKTTGETLPTTPSKTTSKKKYRIEKLQLHNIQFEAGKYTISPLPYIELHSLGPLTLTGIVDTILENMNRKQPQIESLLKKDPLDKVKKSFDRAYRYVENLFSH